MTPAIELSYRVEREIFGNVQNTVSLPEASLHLGLTKDCPYCAARLESLVDESRPYAYETVRVTYVRCPDCAWWRKRWIPDRYFVGEVFVGSLHAPGRSVTKAVGDALSTVESDAHLLSMTTTQVERWIGDVLAAAYGCEALHVGRAGDGGIDVLLFDSKDGPVAVQVKHRRSDGRAEGVAVVRELRGAMVLRGLDRGVVVTTSNRFSKAAQQAAQSDPAQSTQQAIDLIDAKRLLEILQVVSVDGGGHDPQPSPLGDRYWPSAGPPSEATDLADTQRVMQRSEILRPGRIDRSGS